MDSICEHSTCGDPREPLLSSTLSTEKLHEHSLASIVAGAAVCFIDRIVSISLRKSCVETELVSGGGCRPVQLSGRI